MSDIVAHQQDPGGDRSPSRFLLPLGLAIVAIVVVEAALGDVGFGLQGRQLVLAAAAAVYAVVGVLFLRGSRGGAARSMALLFAMAAAVLVMHGADPNGPVIGLFVIAAFTPLREPLQVGTAILVVCTVGYNIEQLFLASESVVLTIATVAGAAFFYLLGTLLRREREQRERVDRLLVELEESRQAEAAAVAQVERSRMAREVHDVLAHTLSGLALQLAAAKILAAEAATDPRLRDAVTRAHRLAKTGLQESRRAVAALRGEGLPGTELIEDLAHEHRLSGGTVAYSQHGDPRPLPPDTGLTLYRAAQEALSNVRKHAPDANVTLALIWGVDAVELTVTDDGGTRRFASPATSGDGESDGGHGQGYGLAGMAERAALAGGAASAEPFETGYRVRVTLPLTTQENE